MFRRGEESEWTRFSRAFPAKEEKKPEGENEEAPGPERTPAEATLEGQPKAAPHPHTNLRVPSDANLTVTRAAGIPAPSAAADEVESIIGPTTIVDGKYHCENGVRIQGTAKGEIESSKVIFIEESAKVTAKVVAAMIIVAGEVSGELHCTGRVEIRPCGRVTGTINAGTLVMQEGAFFDGNLKMRTAGAEQEATPASAET